MHSRRGQVLATLAGAPLLDAWCWPLAQARKRKGDRARKYEKTRAKTGHRGCYDARNSRS